MMHTENVTYRNILGVKVACFDWAGAFAFFENRINEGRFMKQGWLNANNSNIADTDPAYRAVLEDFLILPAQYY